MLRLSPARRATLQRITFPPFPNPSTSIAVSEDPVKVLNPKGPLQPLVHPHLYSSFDVSSNLVQNCGYN